MRIQLNSLAACILATVLALIAAGCNDNAADEEQQEVFGYAIEHAYLNLSSAEVMAIYRAKASLDAELKWMETNNMGAVIVNPRDGSKDFNEQYILLGNRVCQYTRQEDFDQAVWDKITSELIKNYGEPQAVPPEWAAYSRYLKDLEASQETLSETMFWGDRDKSMVMSATWSEETGQMYFLIFDPVRFDEIDSIIHAQNQRRKLHQNQGKQPDEQPAEDGEPAAGADDDPQETDDEQQQDD